MAVVRYQTDLTKVNKLTVLQNKIREAHWASQALRRDECLTQDQDELIRLALVQATGQLEEAINKYKGRPVKIEEDEG